MEISALMVSVIVPVYNSEKYLTECIESIMAQHYSNIEVILIDDGSTDNSGRIIDNYAQRYSQIRAIHTDNQGVSSARNCGIEMSSGDFITFIDADDWITPDYVEYLLQVLISTNSDFAISTKHFTNRDSNSR